MVEILEFLQYVLDPTQNLGSKTFIISALLIIILRLIPNLHLVESLAVKIQTWFRDRANSELSAELKRAKAELDSLEAVHVQELERYELELNQKLQVYPYELLIMVLTRLLSIMDYQLKSDDLIGLKQEIDELKERLDNYEQQTIDKTQ